MGLIKLFFYYHWLQNDTKMKLSAVGKNIIKIRETVQEILYFEKKAIEILRLLDFKNLLSTPKDTNGPDFHFYWFLGIIDIKQGVWYIIGHINCNNLENQIFFTSYRSILRNRVSCENMQSKKKIYAFFDLGMKNFIRFNLLSRFQGPSSILGRNVFYIKSRKISMIFSLQTAGNFIVFSITK